MVRAAEARVCPGMSAGRDEAGAAVPLTSLISQSARSGLAGLEIFTGIPGTVGGSLRGNAGSRQGSVVVMP